MENVQKSSHINHVNSDPVSLEGLDDFLEGMLDRVFDVEVDQSTNVRVLRQKTTQPANPQAAPVEEADTTDSDINIDDLFDTKDIISNGLGLFSHSKRDESLLDKPSLFEADEDPRVELELKIRLLESQLDYRNKELRESFNRLKFMEGQILAKDDQLRLVPELIKRGADATKYEFELEDLKEQLEALQVDLEFTQSTLVKLKNNWAGKLGLWLTREEKK